MDTNTSCHILVVVISISNTTNSLKTHHFRGSDQRTNQILAHRADVNTVCFVDDNTNVLASGADDGIVKVISVTDIPSLLSCYLRSGTGDLSGSLSPSQWVSSLVTLMVWCTSPARETGGTWPVTTRTRASKLRILYSFSGFATS